MRRRGLAAPTALLLATHAGAAPPPASADPSPPPVARADAREPCARRDPLRRLFFGDTHVHTALSLDAWGQGTLARPADAYRFARGEEVAIQPFGPNGEVLRRVRLRRPLDFAVVTDHAELLGETAWCQTPGSPGWDSLVCTLARRWPKLGYVIVNSQIYARGRGSRTRD